MKLNSLLQEGWRKTQYFPERWHNKLAETLGQQKSINQVWNCSQVTSYSEQQLYELKAFKYEASNTYKEVKVTPGEKPLTKYKTFNTY
jgi:hypothetical protein